MLEPSLMLKLESLVKIIVPVNVEIIMVVVSQFYLSILFYRPVLHLVGKLCL